MSETPSILALPPTHLLIGDKFLREGSGGVHIHINPATGLAQAEVPLGGRAEINQAVAAAKAAFESWRKTPRTLRRDLLLRLGALIRENANAFSQYSTREIGVASKLATRGPASTEQWFAYYAGWADKIEGKVSSVNPGQRLDYTMPEPYGVIGVIATWNGPLFSMGMKVAPALAAGNTVVIKPAEHNPFVMSLFAKLALEAGFPPGVINVVTGTVAAGEALVGHSDVKKITFTGGPIAARRIMMSAAGNLTPVMFELGGKSANIIFPDADMDRAINDAVLFSVQLQSGQGCAFGTRLLVQRDVYDQVVQRVKQRVESLVVGDPMLATTDMGPVINEQACERLTRMTQEARGRRDGRLITGGERLGGELEKGFFFKPTVFADVKPDSLLAQEECFGPLLSIIAFDTERDAVDIANSTRYGLAAYLQTSDINRAQRFASELRAGSVYINGGSGLSPYAPFGGEGLSGFGREGGKEGLDEFLRSKTVTVQNVPPMA